MKYEYERKFRQVVKLCNTMFSRKASKLTTMLSVPRTNTRGQGEYPKAIELTAVKELCKLIP